MNKTRRMTSTVCRLAAIVFALIMVLGALPFLKGAFIASGYETNTFKDFQPTPLGIENPQFANHSGSLPAAPSGWTETAYPGKNAGATAMGVLDLEIYNTEENRRNAKLEEYDEFQGGAVPRSPFGKQGVIAAKDGGEKILLINTTEATTTVIGYESSSLTLAANKYFRISAWIKTGDFYSQYGAAIRLNGIENHNISFSNIRTNQYVDPVTKEKVFTKDNFFGWEKYTFYIKTSSIRSESVNLALTVGDYYRGKDQNGGNIIINQNAGGYAFFGNIEADEISPSNYNFSKQFDGADDLKFIDLSLPVADSATGEEDPLKQSDALSLVPKTAGGDVLKNYTLASVKGQGIQTSDLVYPALLNAEISFSPKNNPFNLSEAPVPPSGKYSGDANILVLSSYRESRDDYKATAVGYESGDIKQPVGPGNNLIKIKQFHYYRLSVWVKTQDISGGAGATLVVTTNRPNRLDSEKLMDFRATGCEGNSANTASYGFSEYAFYIKGSAYFDYNITLGMWLGQEDNLTRGTAMFASPKLELLTAAQYSENAGSSAGGTPVDVDTERTETGITNGNFAGYTISTDEEHPLSIPNGWTLNTPEYKGTDTDKIISGIMQTNEQHFWENIDDYGAGAVRPLQDDVTLLYMASFAPNAFNYASSPIALDAAAAYAVTASMRIDNIVGYGASLVLKDDAGVIATIENLSNTGGDFKNFTFYVENDGSSRSLTLEIWLGMTDRNGTSRKLSSGNLYVQSVKMEDVDTTVFAQRQIAYKSALNSANYLKNFAVYSYSSMNFTEFDAYTADFIKYPYLWSISGPNNASPVGVRSGIFDSANIPIGVGTIPSYFKNPDSRDENGNLKNNFVLILENAAKTSSRLTYDRSYTLTSQSHYRLDISIKTDIKIDEDLDPDSEAARTSNTVRSIGAGVELTGTDFKFENILSTVNPQNPAEPEAFRTYTFYISTGEQSPSFQLAFTLGGDNYDEFCMGRMYVNSVSFTDITDSLYEEETGKITSDTVDIMRAEFKASEAEAEETVTETEPKNSMDWAIIPSILFAVALLLALSLVFVRRIGDRIRAKRLRSGAGAGVTVPDYDRAAAEKGYKDFTTDGTVVSGADEQASYDEFDDSTPPIKTEKERKLDERKAVIQAATAQDDVKPVKPQSNFEDGFED